ncbi:MAG: universal stress protein [Bacteroidota bacterium]|nr:universal stress protein [Bacteroidota bacterium]
MVANFKNIVLVPTDFSEVCANAAHQAVDTAKLLNFKVVLLHVVNAETKAYLKEEKLPDESIDQQLKEMAEDLQGKSGVTVEYISKEGSIFTAISDVANEIGANLIYLGTHGKTGMQHFTGSFALKVVTSSTIPVVVVQKRPIDKGYKDILLPITSDVCTPEKAAWAIYVSREFNATMHILVIGDAGDLIYESAHEIARIFAKNGVKYTFEEAEKHSHFSKYTIDYATSKNTDLIMIMTHPDNKVVPQFMLASYDEEVIFNTTQIPVLCVNPREIDFELIG